MALGIFESMAADDGEAHVALRKATAVATKRVNDRFAAFLAAADSPSERTARLNLVRGDIREVIASACNEYGGDPKSIETSVLSRLAHPFDPGQPGTFDPNADPNNLGGPHDDIRGPADGLEGPQPTNTWNCKDCGTPMERHRGQGDVNCPNCGAEHNSFGQRLAPRSQWGEETGESLADIVGPDPNDGPDYGYGGGPWDMNSSVHTARRPKMCPYHREVTDIALASGNPEAGFNAMAQHAWGANHCQGEYEGGCNFKPAMVTQKFWDDKAEQAEERRQQRQLEQERQQENQFDVPDSPEGLSDTEPVADPLDGPSINDELADAPSAVGDGVTDDTNAIQQTLEPMAASATPTMKRAKALMKEAIGQPYIEPDPNNPSAKEQGEAQDAAHAEAEPRSINLEPNWDGMRAWVLEVAKTDPKAAEGIVKAMGSEAPPELMARGGAPTPGFDDQGRGLGFNDQGAAIPRDGSTRSAEALKTVDVDAGGETPSPKMDKTKWKPNVLNPSGNLPVEPEGIEMDGSPVPTQRVDILEPIPDQRSDDFLEGTRSVTEDQAIDKAPGYNLSDADSGSWAGNNGASPVTSAVDPNVNPLQRIVEEEFVPPSQVESAIQAFDANTQ